MKTDIKVILAFLIGGFVLINYNCDGQTKQQTGCCNGFQDSILHKPIYECGDRSPEPIEGMPALYKQLSKKLKISQRHYGGFFRENNIRVCC